MSDLLTRIGTARNLFSQQFLSLFVEQERIFELRNLFERNGRGERWDKALQAEPRLIKNFDILMEVFEDRDKSQALPMLGHQMVEFIRNEEDVVRIVSRHSAAFCQLRDEVNGD